MYEQFYGLSAPPFQIHPDPSFYFESKGHGSAYQYLRFGAFQGEGFIVVTGEIGAGKTTLLRALLAELDASKVVAAQIVSTQLQADDLLSAVALAFGINVEGLSKAKLLVTLEAYLATLATSSRRALLIIDEAQNLSPEAIEELRMLSNFQFGSRALLQSFLVGQPELRDILRLPQMEQLRQRVLASCHLGPMQASETRGYIEHRMRRVGWSGRPAFEAAAFDAIHHATGGVPRRINTLCSRLLLSAFLDSSESIDAQRVRQVEREIRAEISGVSVQAPPARDADVGDVLCLAASFRSLAMVSELLRAFAAREDLPPARLLRVLGADALAPGVQAERDLASLGLNDPGETLVLTAPTPAGRMAETAAAMAARLESPVPAALLVAGDEPAALACAMVAAEAGVPVVRVEAGLARGDRDAPWQRRRVQLDHAASLGFAPDDEALQRLKGEGVQPRQVHVVGSLAKAAARQALGASAQPAQIFRREGVALSILDDPAGYILVAPRDPGEAACERLAGLDARLRRLGWRVRMVWPVDAARHQELRTQCAQFSGGTVHVIRCDDHGEMPGLMRHARCVLTDSDWLREQAAVLGVPCLALGHPGVPRDPTQVLERQVADIIAGGARVLQEVPPGDPQVADRIASVMSDWLLARRDSAYLSFLENT